MNPSEWVVLARVERTRGLRGEMFVSSWSGGPETFQARSVSLRRGGAVERDARIEDVWRQGDRVIVKLEGVDSIEAAEALRGVELCVRRQDRLPLEEGEVYYSDLVGCELFDSGRPVGRITGWQEAPGSVLLTVRHGDRESLVPFVRAICTEVDLPNRRINAVLPVGLLDL